MKWVPLQLRYNLKYAGRPAGEQRIVLEPRREGIKLVLEATVELPPPKTRQRWESELDARGLPRRYRERVEGNGARVMEVEFSREDGLVTVSQGKEDLAIPYLTDMHDPLSLILALGRLRLQVGEVKRFDLVGGRVYAERLPDQRTEGQVLWVYRLRPGLSLLYFDEQGYPVRLTQKVGEHVFEVERVAVEAQAGLPSPQQETPSRVVAGEPPKERRAAFRHRRRRRRYA
ncbi:MAG: DUF3108 domain-containing protein [Meiothermus sp.]|uniref:DUF3108 domain-containing protein n=1 Tax=Meiothermus sp. TaxID=1955249 RepID=UPI0025CBB57C|nr:DUF3108 domain-containing protein [Meiothermus sp.]MCS7059362.1 DUF3108 domain-containing protein [Meiothermus sp.]MCS7194598.1 DUF3108 domain-containing protein [Meiothermus sp.]MCX7740787.1 DUF3108 domain-containing protein [Meiothermus sp.]MDW8091979.1 DUF3108 domain-containing protein [Meiothermus sp.]MDW8481894.1 DUF3108 domain-containing protein [Meiothermus sp.]